MNKANSKWSLITRDKAKRDKRQPMVIMPWFDITEKFLADYSLRKPYDFAPYTDLIDKFR